MSKKDAGIFLSSVVAAVIAVVAGPHAGAAAYALGMKVFAISLVSSYALSALAPKPPKTALSGEYINVNLLGSALPTATIYGRTRIGGAVFYQESTNNNTKVNVLIAFANHEIQEFEEIYFNEELITLDEDGNVTAPAKFVNRAKVIQRLGTDDQEAVEIEGSETWDADHRARGIAYLYIALNYSRDAFPNGIPTVTATAKGKKLYDPRTETTAYSNNSALCLRDFLVSSGIADIDELDDTLFAAAANVCDEIVAFNSVQEAGDFVTGQLYEIKFVGTTDFTAIGAASNAVGVKFTATGPGTGTGEAYDAQYRYTSNGSFTSDSNPQSIAQNLLSPMGGMMWYQNGKWGCKASAFTASVLTLDEDDLRSGLSISTRNTRRDGFNKVIGLFRGEQSNWQPTNFPAVTSQTFIDIDGGEVSTTELDLPFVNTPSQAQRIAKLALYRNREQLKITGAFGMRALQVGVGDIITLNNTRLGFSNKLFEVLEWRFGLGEGNVLQINMVLQEISSAVFEFDVTDETVFESNNTVLPNSFDVPRLGLDVSTIFQTTEEKLVRSLLINVSSNRPEAVDHVEVEYRTNSVPANYILRGISIVVDMLKDVVGIGDGLFLVEINGRKLGDIDNSGSVTVSDIIIMLEYVAGIPIDEDEEEYITTTMVVYMMQNYETYSRYLAERITIIPDFVSVGTGALGQYLIPDVQISDYEIRARPVNTFGVKGEYEIITIKPSDSQAPTSDVTNFNASVINGSAFLEWDPVQDRTLSHYRIRHSSLTSGAKWADSYVMGEKIARPGNTALLPAKAGTYMIRAYNKNDIPSEDFASAVITSDDIEQFSQNIFIGAQESLTAGAFSGSKSDTIVESSKLILDPESDDAEGLYTLTGNTDNYIETHDSTARRVRASIIITSTRNDKTAGNLFDIQRPFDELEGLFDTFTGSPEFGDTNIRRFVRSTEDDPASSPTWSAWKRIDSGEIYGRAFQFRVMLTSEYFVYNAGSPAGSEQVMVSQAISNLDAVIRY